MKMLRVVYPESVKRSRTHLCGPEKISARFRLERMKTALRIFLRAFFQDKIDIFSLRRPEPEMRLIWTNQFGADRVAAICARRSALSLCLLQSDFSFHPKIDN